jgi:hypothetical protein
VLFVVGTGFVLDGLLRPGKIFTQHYRRDRMRIKQLRISEEPRRHRDRRDYPGAPARNTRFLALLALRASVVRYPLGPRSAAPNKANLPRFWAENEGALENKANRRGRGRDWGFAGGGHAASVDRMSNRANLPLPATWRAALARDSRYEMADTRYASAVWTLRQTNPILGAGTALQLIKDQG